MRQSREARILWPVGLACLAAVLRLLAALAFQPWRDPSIGWETVEIARHLSEGRGFLLDVGMIEGNARPTAWIAPLYPALVSLFFRIFADSTSNAITAVILFQILCSALTVFALHRFTEGIAGPRVARLAATLLALSPASINMSTRILWGTSLLALQIVLLAWLCVGVQRGSRGLRRSVAIGLFGGAMILNSPASALLMVAIAIWSWSRLGRRALPQLAVTATTTALVLAPWIWRNHQQFGAVIFIKSNFGNELFIGNNPLADGDYRRAGDLAREVLTPAELASLARDELMWSRGLGAHALDWIRTEPATFLKLTLRRTWRYWTAPFLSDWSKLSALGNERVARWAYRLGQALALLLALLGLRRLCGAGSCGRLPVLFMLLFPLPYYLTHVSITRYRYPVLPLVFLCSAAGWVALRKASPGRMEGEHTN